MKYKPELKEKILKEVKDSKNISAVARKHKMPDSTIHTWLSKQHKDKPAEQTYCEIKKLRKELSDTKLQNLILKDLLKKTNQVWLSE
jgi:transposase-like protein